MPDPMPLTLAQRAEQMRAAARRAPEADELPPAPAGFGLDWEDKGVTTNFRGPYRHSSAPATRAFQAAWDIYSFRETLRSWGYTSGPTTVTHYGRGVAVDRETMGRMEERAARDVARVDAEAEAARQRLEAAMRNIGWAMSPQTLTEARKVVAEGVATAGGLDRVAELIRRTEATIDRAREALQADVDAAPEDLLRRFVDPELCDAVHAGCRYLSDRDGDLATVVNGEGWSQATSRLGHLVSQCGRLDPAHAAVGLGLLSGHRGQLPDDLDGVLFPGIPRPRRRRAPAPAAQQGLGL